MTDKAQILWDLQAQLGEGALWDERDDSLWFTDIRRQAIYRYDPASGQHREWKAPEPVSFVVPAASGGFLAGLQSGLHRFSAESGEFHLLARPEPDCPGNRLNDAVVDPAGRLWFGTMDNEEQRKSGAFYCYFRGELRATGIKDICITNGPAVSPDGKWLYWVDTKAGAIHRCGIREDGSLDSGGPLIKIDPSEGHPDGPAVDSDGFIWIALYGGWEARRYSPDGELADRVAFPVANVTKVALGGPDLRCGFATTARQKLDADALSKQPLAGGLFEFRAPAPGFASPAVADR